MKELLTGGQAVAWAMRQIDPDVVPVYPITPQTPIIQGFAKFVADGRAHAELVNVESEHSAMSAAIGSALAGARTMTATSSQGLALMAEVVYIAASMRAPIVMAVGNRALSGPINIHCDHSDSMLIRDSGVIQLFAENAQEAYDLMVLAPRIAEHPGVLLPVLVCLDGFTITHAAEPVELLSDDEVHAFVGDYRISTSAARRQRFRTLTGRLRCRTTTSSSVVSRLLRSRRPARARGSRLRVRRSHRPPSARSTPTGSTAPTRAIVALGSTAGTVKESSMSCARRESVSACCGSARSVRFPAVMSRQLLAGIEHVIVLDRSDSPGGTPPLHAEIASALYGSDSTLRGHVYGLGGRDLHPDDIRELFAGEPAALRRRAR